MYNLFAKKTIKYIWSHPNCKNQQIQSVFKFFGWQVYKRLMRRYLDIQVIPGVKIRCYPDSYSSAAALYCGLYDYNDMNFLLRYLQPQDSFLDIGANVGIYTLLAASKIKSGAIYSFEVLPKNYARLEENLKLNQFNQVKTYAVAISDSTGTIALNLADGDCKASVIAKASDNTILVPTDTLDNLIQEEFLPNLTLAKMDIEGAEILAFKGAASLLKQQRPLVWILEILNDTNDLAHQEQNVVDLLQSYGYGLYHYNADTNQILPIALHQKQGNNVLAIAEEAVDFVRHRLTDIKSA